MSAVNLAEVFAKLAERGLSQREADMIVYRYRLAGRPLRRGAGASDRRAAPGDEVARAFPRRSRLSCARPARAAAHSHGRQELGEARSRDRDQGGQVGDMSTMSELETARDVSHRHHPPRLDGGRDPRPHPPALPGADLHRPVHPPAPLRSRQGGAGAAALDQDGRLPGGLRLLRPERPLRDRRQGDQADGGGGDRGRGAARPGQRRHPLLHGRGLALAQGPRHRRPVPGHRRREGPGP